MSIQERFEKYHTENPQVYALLVKFSLELKQTGHNGSVDYVYQRVRWHCEVDIKTQDTYKMNDHFRSRYARLIMNQVPELAGFFETRELKTA